MNSSNLQCSQLSLPTIVGPAQVFSSLGHWNTAVYVILVLHLLPVWVVSTITIFRLPKQVPSHLVTTLSCLALVPPTLMGLTSVGILFPSLGVYVEVLLEIVLSLALITFIHFCRTVCGGDQVIVDFCRNKKILLPIGSPPFICLMLCPRPQVTRTSFRMVAAMPLLLLATKLMVFVTDILFLVFGYKAEGSFFALDNLHNIIGFPVGLISMYCYTIFNVLMNDCLAGQNSRFLGVILLLQFVLFDCLRLFFIFLTGTGMLTCVPPFLSQDLVVHTLKNYIKAFLATLVGIPFLALMVKGRENKQPPTIGRVGSVASMLTGSDSGGNKDEGRMATGNRLDGEVSEEMESGNMYGNRSPSVQPRKHKQKLCRIQGT